MTDDMSIEGGKEVLPVLKTSLARILGDVKVQELVTADQVDAITAALAEQISARIKYALAQWAHTQKAGLTEEFTAVLPHSVFEVVLRVEGRSVQINPETDPGIAIELAEQINTMTLREEGSHLVVERSHRVEERQTPAP